MPLKEFAHSQDWKLYQNIIRRMYMDENRTLKDVKLIMSAKYGFNATTKMYKTHLAAWGLIKKLKDHEAELILDLQARRAACGKASVFKVRGRTVNTVRLQRYRVTKRKKSRTATTTCQAQKDQIIDLECYTPNTTREESPLELNSETQDDGPSQPLFITSNNPLERFLVMVRNYILGSFERRFWTPELMNQWIPISMESTIIATKTPSKSCDLYTIMFQAVTFFAEGENSLGGWCSRKAFAMVDDVLFGENAFTLWELFNTVTLLCESGMDQLLKHFLDHVGHMAAVRRNSSHPLSTIFLGSAEMSGAELLVAIAAMRDRAADHFESVLGTSSPSSLLLRLGSLRAAGLLDHTNYAEEQMIDRLKSCRGRSFEDEIRRITVLNRLGHFYFERKEFAKAEKIAHQIIASVVADHQCCLNFGGRALTLLANSQLFQRKFELARTNAEALIRWNLNNVGPDSPFTLSSLNLLRHCQLGAGLVHEAKMTMCCILKCLRFCTDARVWIESFSTPQDSQDIVPKDCSIYS